MRRRAVTALGVACIVGGSLGGIASLAVAIEGYRLSTLVGPPLTTFREAPVCVTPRPARDETLRAGERADVDVALNSLLMLDPPHHGPPQHTPPSSAELTRFLTFHGRAVFGGDDDADPPLTAASVRAAVQAYQTAKESADSAAHFSAVLGKVDVYADHVLFTSADGSRILSTSMHGGPQFEKSPPPQWERGSNGRAQTGALPEAQVEQALTPLRQRGGASLNAAQLATVRGRLLAPNQQLVAPGSSTPVSSVTTFPNNEVTIQFESGWLTLIERPRPRRTPLMRHAARPPQRRWLSTNENDSRTLIRDRNLIRDGYRAIAGAYPRP